MKMATNNFGQKLRSLRLQRGLSQSDLAEPGLSAGYISLLENGKRPPTSEVILRIAARLDVSPEVLSSAQESATVSGPQDAEADDAVRISLLRGDLAFAEGDFPAACDLFATALEDAARSVVSRMAALRRLARACEQLGDLDKASGLYRQWLDLHQEQPRPRRVGQWLTCASSLVRCMVERGRLEEAVVFGAEAVERARAVGVAGVPPAVELASSVQYAGYCRGEQDRTDIDARALEEAAAGFFSREARVEAYVSAARGAEEHGDQERARALLVEALRTRTAEAWAVSGDRIAVSVLAQAAYRSRPLPARLSCEVRPAVQRLQAHGTALEAALGAAGAAGVLLGSGESEEAQRMADEALSAIPAPYRLSRAQAALTNGRAFRALGRYEQAQDCYEQASTQMTGMGLDWLGATVLFELAELREQMGDAAGALSAYRTASKTVRAGRGG
ncbi:hypothetical protein ADL21_02940 [Streptomyces albus subsp. albus]|nr:hypothetical protein ADL21_02940 [Streptomyces albus subsp. albus]